MASVSVDPVPMDCENQGDKDKSKTVPDSADVDSKMEVEGSQGNSSHVPETEGGVADDKPEIGGEVREGGGEETIAAEEEEGDKDGEGGGKLEKVESRELKEGDGKTGGGPEKKEKDSKDEKKGGCKEEMKKDGEGEKKKVKNNQDNGEDGEGEKKEVKKKVGGGGKGGSKGDGGKKTGEEMQQKVAPDQPSANSDTPKDPSIADDDPSVDEDDQQRPAKEGAGWFARSSHRRRVYLPQKPSAWSSYDTQQYRDGYPGKRDYPSQRLNYLFYANSIASRPRGMKIDEFHTQMRGNYRELEWNHSYIQWLFPIREQGMNMAAQELQLHEIQDILRDKEAVRRLELSYQLMLDFYGMKLKSSEGELERTDNYKERFRNLNRSSHNYLRITRILKCLGEFQLEHLKVPFIEFVLHEAIVTGELSNVLHSCMCYWVEVLRDQGERERVWQLAREMTDRVNADHKPSPPQHGTRPGDQRGIKPQAQHGTQSQQEPQSQHGTQTRAKNKDVVQKQPTSSTEGKSGDKKEKRGWMSLGGKKKDDKNGSGAKGDCVGGEGKNSKGIQTHQNAEEVSVITQQPNSTSVTGSKHMPSSENSDTIASVTSEAGAGANGGSGGGTSASGGCGASGEGGNSGEGAAGVGGEGGDGAGGEGGDGAGGEGIEDTNSNGAGDNKLTI